MKTINSLLIFILILTISRCASATAIKVTDTATDYYIDNGYYNISVGKTIGTIQHLYYNGSSDDIIDNNREGFGAAEYHDGNNNLWCRNRFAQKDDCSFTVVKNTSKYIEVKASLRQRFSDGTLSNLTTSYIYKFRIDKPYFYMLVNNSIDKNGINATDYSVDFISKNDWMNECWYNDYSNTPQKYTEMQAIDFTTGNGQNPSWMFAKNNMYNDGFAVMLLSMTKYPLRDTLLQPNWGGGDEFEYSMNWGGEYLDSSQSSTSEYIIYPTNNYHNIIDLEANITKQKTIGNIINYLPFSIPISGGDQASVGNINTWTQAIGGTQIIGVTAPIHQLADNYLIDAPYIVDSDTHYLGESQPTYTYYNNGSYSRLEKHYPTNYNLSLEVDYETWSTSPAVRVKYIWTAVSDTQPIYQLYNKLYNGDSNTTHNSLNRMLYNGTIHDLSLNDNYILPRTSSLNPKWIYWYNASYPNNGVYIVTPNTNSTDQYEIYDDPSFEAYNIFGYYNNSGQKFSAGQTISNEYWFISSPSCNISSLINTSNLYTSPLLNYYTFDSNTSLFDNIFPIANFSSNVSEGAAPLTVQFTDLSENATEWKWDFDNNGVIDSTDRNPIYEYLVPEIYIVNQTVTNENETNSKLATINVSKTSSSVYPIANFSSNVSEGFAPLTIQFTDLSENATEWKWNFGDGITSIEQNPVHTYSTEGNYNVNLTVSNENGTNSINSTINAIPYLVPVANFSSNVSEGVAPLTVQFTDLSENATEWKWDFGNNGVVDSTDRNPIYEYLVPGVYTVNQTVINENGTKQVLNNCDNLGSTDYDYYVTRTIDTTNKVEGTGSFRCVTTSTGNVYILLRNTSRWNLSSATYILANVKAPEGKSMVLRLFSSEDSDFVNFMFTGNGKWQHIEVPFKQLYNIGSFNSSSVYDIRIDMIDSEVGDTYYVDSITTDAYINTYNSKLATINVSKTPSSVYPIANFSSNVSEGFAPLTIQFTDLSENATEWKWNFGDGITSIEQNPVHTYSTEGNYNVNLTVSNEKETNSTTKQIISI
jgi:PKD repeat protein